VGQSIACKLDSTLPGAGLRTSADVGDDALLRPSKALQTEDIAEEAMRLLLGEYHGHLHMNNRGRDTFLRSPQRAHSFAPRALLIFAAITPVLLLRVGSDAPPSHLQTPSVTLSTIVPLAWPPGAAGVRNRSRHLRAAFHRIVAVRGGGLTLAYVAAGLQDTAIWL
jgi:hypothetical protein